MQILLGRFSFLFLDEDVLFQYEGLLQNQEENVSKWFLSRVEKTSVLPAW